MERYSAVVVLVSLNCNRATSSFVLKLIEIQEKPIRPHCAIALAGCVCACAAVASTRDGKPAKHIGALSAHNVELARKPRPVVRSQTNGRAGARTSRLAISLFAPGHKRPAQRRVGRGSQRQTDVLAGLLGT